MIELSVCPACSELAHAARLLKRINCRNRGNGSLTIRLVGCPCSHVFINPQPSSQELAPYYRSDYHVFANPIAMDSAVDQLIAAKLRGDRLNHALVVKGGRYLDIGCGLGEMVRAFGRTRRGAAPGYWRLAARYEYYAPAHHGADQYVPPCVCS